MINLPGWMAFNDQLKKTLVIIYQIIILLLMTVLPFWMKKYFQQYSIPAPTQISMFYLPYLLGWVYLTSAFLITSLRRTEDAGRAFSILASSLALLPGSISGLTYSRPLLILCSAIIPLTGAAFFHFGLFFPQKSSIAKKHRPLAQTGYITAVLLIILQNIFPGSVFLQIGWLFTAISVLSFIFSVGIAGYTSPSPIIRQSASISLLGLLLSIVPATLSMLFSTLHLPPLTPALVILPLAIFPTTTAYIMIKHHPFQAGNLSDKSTTYYLLHILAFSGYTLIALGPGMLVEKALGPNQPLTIGITVLITILLFNGVYIRIRNKIDLIFLKNEHAYKNNLAHFERALTKATGLLDILHLLQTEVRKFFQPDILHIFIYDPLLDIYSALPDENGQPTSGIRFSGNNPIVKILQQESAPLFLSDNRIPESLRPEYGRIALSGANMFIPIPGQQKLHGWVAVSERISGEKYSGPDILFLTTLCSQTSTALNRALTITNLERRIHELSALSRVAQGINITLNFDDVLELIYAQTTQIIPNSDFHLILYKKSGNYAYYAFCLENEDRITSKENLPLPEKTCLEEEVIHSQKPILSQDFSTQCQIAGISPPMKNHIYAWLGVPLNSGTETIGAISVASNNPTTIYSRAQMNLLQAVADQAASAIIKTQLLKETERRAQQLASLNEINRKLTSTLELQPLLNSILESAVDILNTEAGSLFLVDERTDELIFQVTVGPVSHNLVGQRLAPGTGFVGSAVINRQPIIINNVNTSPTWNPLPDKQTGFTTRGILAVPLESKDRVIGVIEIINKKDGNPFTTEDQNLLTAFAGQAAVAIDNARLYTLTDQELSNRVEELSVMQRLDRELNASLEVDRPMRITLEWAMRQSKSDAGLIGFVSEKGLRIIASQGYGDEIEFLRDGFIPLEHPAFQQAIQSGQSTHSIITQPDQPQTFLMNAHRQFVMPIRRKSDVIGLFLLESTNPNAFKETETAFLSRLADHAAIAIANSQLYSEVQQANIAKSEFVSFVAHELKNPMTSIKGYAELLTAGAVGPMNDMQNNFLGTIRANIERMKTIVEDLNDNSKIEAGRLRLDYKAVSIDEIIENAIRSIHRQLDDKKQTLELDIPTDIPKIWADKTRMEQVLINLISNANKYTSENGNIHIHAEKNVNIWDEHGAPEVIHIWVKDNGLGISQDDQKKIFQKFFRSDDEQVRKSPGTGLGLNITKSLIELQGGHIWFESEIKKGTTFHITIPVSEN